MKLLKFKTIYIIENREKYCIDVKCYDESGEVIFSNDNNIYVKSDDYTQIIGKHNTKPFIASFTADKNFIDVPNDTDRINLTYIYENLGCELIYYHININNSLHIRIKSFDFIKNNVFIELKNDDGSYSPVSNPFSFYELGLLINDTCNYDNKLYRNIDELKLFTVIEIT